MLKRKLVIFGWLLFTGACWMIAAQQPAAARRTMLFEGARLFLGDGNAPIEDAHGHRRIKTFNVL